MFTKKLNNTSISFMKYHRIALALSCFFILASFVSFGVKKFNFGIDFTGGVLVELKANNVSLSDLRKDMSAEGFEGVSLQNFGKDGIMIRLPLVGDKDSKGNESMAMVDAVKNLLSEKYQNKVEVRKVDFVGPQVGSELILKGLLALTLSFAAIMFYIWIRFDWQFGVGAVIALVHDAILILGLFSITGLEFNLTAVAAVLTIVGYSINDSVVIYDRIRENMRKYKKMEIREILDTSLNSTLSRTVLTAGSTLLALIPLIMFGGATLESFSKAVFFGVIIGTYSSIYISAPVLIYMKIENFVNKKKDK